MDTEKIKQTVKRLLLSQAGQPVTVVTMAMVENRVKSYLNELYPDQDFIVTATPEGNRVSVQIVPIVSYILISVDVADAQPTSPLPN